MVYCPLLELRPSKRRPSLTGQPASPAASPASPALSKKPCVSRPGMYHDLFSKCKFMFVHFASCCSCCFWISSTVSTWTYWYLGLRSSRRVFGLLLYRLSDLWDAVTRLQQFTKCAPRNPALRMDLPRQRRQRIWTSCDWFESKFQIHVEHILHLVFRCWICCLWVWHIIASPVLETQVLGSANLSDKIC